MASQDLSFSCGGENSHKQSLGVERFYWCVSWHFWNTQKHNVGYIFDTFHCQDESNNEEKHLIIQHRFLRTPSMLFCCTKKSYRIYNVNMISSIFSSYPGWAPGPGRVWAVCCGVQRPCQPQKAGLSIRVRSGPLGSPAGACPHRLSGTLEEIGGVLKGGGADGLFLTELALHDQVCITTFLTIWLCVAEQQVHIRTQQGIGVGGGAKGGGVWCHWQSFTAQRLEVHVVGQLCDEDDTQAQHTHTSC